MRVKRDIIQVTRPGKENGNGYVKGGRAFRNGMENNIRCMYV